MKTLHTPDWVAETMTDMLCDNTITALHVARSSLGTARLHFESAGDLQSSAKLATAQNEITEVLQKLE